MAQRIDISNAAVHGHVAALVTHPGYYYLYALYADYPLNAELLRRREYALLLAERVRVIQPLLGLVQPYRKSMALRLFTERASLGRFPPERVAEAWRQLRELIARVGPPPGWPHAPAPLPPAYAHPIPPALQRLRRPRSAAPRAAPAEPVRLPKPPIDYTQDV